MPGDFPRWALNATELGRDRFDRVASFSFLDITSCFVVFQTNLAVMRLLKGFPVSILLLIEVCPWATRTPPVGGLWQLIRRQANFCTEQKTLLQFRLLVDASSRTDAALVMSTFSFFLIFTLRGQCRRRNTATRRVISCQGRYCRLLFKFEAAR